MNKTIVYTEKISKAEMSSFLGSIWGINSPLKAVTNLFDDDKYTVGSSKYYGAKHKKRLIALLGIKILDNKTIEIGSLSVDPSYRKMGISKQLFVWTEETVRKLVLEGYQIVGYATIGSEVMNFIGERIKHLSKLRTFPLNLGIGVVPINQEKINDVLSNTEMIVELNNRYYTSTISILASNRNVYYENIDSIKNLNINILYKKKDTTSKTGNINISYKLDPIRIAVSIIKENFRKIEISKEYFNQIQVPVLHEFEEIHYKLKKKYVITGFAINEDVLHIVYSNITKKKLLKNLMYINKVRDFEFYKEWIEIIEKINNL